MNKLTFPRREFISSVAAVGCLIGAASASAVVSSGSKSLFDIARLAPEEYRKLSFLRGGTVLTKHLKPKGYYPIPSLAKSEQWHSAEWRRNLFRDAEARGEIFLCAVERSHSKWQRTIWFAKKITA